MIDFDRLRRRPDVEAPELVAHDATDRLLLDVAEEALVAHPGHVTVVGDRHGALTLGAATLVGEHELRVHQDSYSGELALAANARALGSPARWASLDLEPSLVEGARVVLVQLPRGLDALDEIAQLVASHAHPDVQVFAGGRVKHMTLAMNDVLGRHFTEVRAGRAHRKSRVLTAAGPAAGPSRWPRREPHGDLVVVARAAAFAGPTVDVGTRLLLDTLASAPVEAERVVDLGCGTGVLAASYALDHPAAVVVATDQSSAAVASARATVEASGVADRVSVLRDDAGGSLPRGSADLVLLNPPFHIGAAVHTGISHKLFTAAARLLRPGGELWCVWNSHLAHRPALERIVGPTRQVARDRVFTVTVSTRR
ncbi:methyltransferase [Frigoribacterium sp. Leaf186]|uniref:class I SAM-dependent methyltransferase n=1 Tax=Frigoribacterium sp. Leaf186 TaxID=1736293 RepID=UPI000B2A82FB|nr:methyltransferase [Frigoribacterium sp. Leaf186]